MKISDTRRLHWPDESEGEVSVNQCTVENMVFCRSVFHCFKDVLALQIHFKGYYCWSWDQCEACCEFQRYLKIFSAAPTPLYKACSLQQLHHVNIMPSQASQALKMAVLHLYGNLE